MNTLFESNLPQVYIGNDTVYKTPSRSIDCPCIKASHNR